ncbi:unnamed protein product [Pleuronectes platessa]|uniref:USP domain-containing protein n=1 Tax=Pleuronectes platessa TaxID=8262 RepID=A0A9N7TI29_PLEPL|nr:unnamed protein product [Pleuronectes platessa]
MTPLPSSHALITSPRTPDPCVHRRGNSPRGLPARRSIPVPFAWGVMLWRQCNLTTRRGSFANSKVNEKKVLKESPHGSTSAASSTFIRQNRPKDALDTLSCPQTRTAKPKELKKEKGKADCWRQQRGNRGVQVGMSWKRNYFASGGGAAGTAQGLVTPRTMTSIAPSKGLSNEPGQNSCFLNSALQCCAASRFITTIETPERGVARRTRAFYGRAMIGSLHSTAAATGTGTLSHAHLSYYQRHV